jgi:hypothetical protein
MLAVMKRFVERYGTQAVDQQVQPSFDEMGLRDVDDACEEDRLCASFCNGDLRGPNLKTRVDLLADCRLKPHPPTEQAKQRDQSKHQRQRLSRKLPSIIRTDEEELDAKRAQTDGDFVCSPADLALARGRYASVHPSVTALDPWREAPITDLYLLLDHV